MKKVAAIVGPIALILLWAIVNQLQIIDPFFLPGPIETLYELLTLLGTGALAQDLFATLLRTLYAFVIAVVIGVPLGLVLGKAEKVYRSLEFIIDFFRSTPATALFPLFLLIFGVGDTAKVAVAAFAATLIIVFNVAYGVIHSKKPRILAAKLMGASRWQIFKWIVFWESLPQTVVGLRNAVSLALVIIIVTEMFIGTDVGLGRRIIDSQIVFNVKAMYASIIVAGFLGYILNAMLLFLERRFVHWGAK